MSEAQIPHDWRAVGMDSTFAYIIAEEDRPYVKRIIDVFFYDKNEHTYVCELTPSYFLRHLYTFIEWADGPEVSAGKQDELDNRYCHEPTDDTYMHCSDVDRLTEFVATLPDSGNDTEDEVREHWQGNCPF
jgi:hypothetical protein